MADRFHIGIDGRELVGRPTGVGRFLAEVLRQWATDEAFSHRLSVFVPGDRPALAGEFGDRVQWVANTGGGSGTWWEQTVLPGHLRKAGAHVLFAPAYTAPLRPSCPFVVVIHDVSFFAHPEWFRPREGMRRRWLTRSAAKRAHRIVTVSEFSAGEIVRYLGENRQRIVVVPHGAPAAVAKDDAEPGRPLVLYVGSLFSRRRIPDLVNGFAQVARAEPEATLVLVGDNRATPPINPRALAERAGVAGRVEWREYVDEATLSALYRSARAFAFLSDYEGFALTPLEAIAHGVPVVLLDTPVTREVYGKAALLVDASAGSIATALLTLLTDERAREAQRAAGRDLLQRYTWRQAAASLQALLEAAAR